MVLAHNRWIRDKNYKPLDAKDNRWRGIARTFGNLIFSGIFAIANKFQSM